MKRLFSLLLLSFITILCFAGGTFQPIVFKAATEVKFKNGIGKAKGKCGDYFAKAPYSGGNGAEFTDFLGDVRVHYKNGPSSDMSYSELINAKGLVEAFTEYLTEHAAGEAIDNEEYKVSFKRSSKGIEEGVVSFEFLTNGVAKPKTYNNTPEINGYLDQIVNASSKSAVDSKDEVWKGQFIYNHELLKNEYAKLLTSATEEFVKEQEHLLDQIQRLSFENVIGEKTPKKMIKVEDGKITTITKADLDPKNYVSYRTYDLVDGGQATIIKTIDNKIILIDGGKTKRDAEQLNEYLIKEFGADVIKRLSIIITHPDADHINVSKWLAGIKRNAQKNDGYLQIIIPNLTDIKNGLKKINSFRESMNKLGYVESLSDDELFLIYTLESKVQEVNIDITINEQENNFVKGHLTIDNSPMTIQFAMNTKSASVNNRSLITTVEHNDFTFLNMGDIERSTIAQMNKLIENKKNDFKNELSKLNSDYNKLTEKKQNLISKIENVELDPNDMYNKAMEEVLLEFEQLESLELELIEHDKGVKLHKELSNASNTNLKPNNLLFTKPNNYLLNSMAERLQKNMVKLIYEFAEFKELRFIKGKLGKKEALDYFTRKKIIEDNKPFYYFDDMIKEISALNEEQIAHNANGSSLSLQTKDFIIKADYMLWPHHHMIPKTEAEEKAFIEFVNNVNPDYIVVSAPPNGVQKGQLDKLKKFLESATKELDIEVLYLRKNGDHVIIEVLNNQLSPVKS